MKKGERMNLNYLDNGVDYEETLPSGDNLKLVMREIRHEHTGTHAHVGIILNNIALEGDDFNVKRRDGRNRLVSSAHDMMSDIVRQDLSKDKLKHLMLQFCLEAPVVWEERRFTLDEIEPTDEILPITWAVWPYIINGGGTIAFGTPESGKSYFCQILACCIASGNRSIWDIPVPRPVLYINLERPKHTMVAREASIRKALNIPGKSGVRYLHARGASLTAINRAVTRYVEDNPGIVIFQDSISRAGQGTLVADDIANKIVDQLNGWGTWLGIGHTSRSSTDHSYGSIHFEAGADTVCKVSSDVVGNRVGIRLEITKMNDARKPRPEYYALVFAGDGSGLVGFERSNEQAFPELASLTKPTLLEEVIGILRHDKQNAPNGIADATTIATVLRDKGVIASRSNVSQIFNDRLDLFVEYPREGKATPYGLLYRGEE